MDQANKEFILNILDKAKDLTLATVRPDGYPQATTVGYAHDGLTIYIGVGKDSQKIANIRHNNKVSLTINTDYQNWNQIKGLSMGCLAEILGDSDEIRRATGCMIKRFPQVIEWLDSGQASEAVFLKITPQIISILNYEKGFGHTNLVTV
ncbi:MAG TPA: pyridoxamine 5'-phosphate oxidase family protein [Burkholderiaceae bacterium]|jgi:nitroimidazol reductase NimA-like FMN-containing flavoprotein (pyridoxamine 5'-phosphate oxidase superfamily)